MLLEAIARHVRETPERPAYQNRTQTLTYGELWHSACALAFRLRAGAGPVLVCGEKDAANLKAARRLAKLLPHAQLHILPGAGHELNTDAPAALAALLKQAR